MGLTVPYEQVQVHAGPVDTVAHTQARKQKQQEQQRDEASHRDHSEIIQRSQAILISAHLMMSLSQLGSSPPSRIEVSTDSRKCCIIMSMPA